MNNKPILCVDFDGVIHSYPSDWAGPTVIKDSPVSGAIEWLERVSEAFDVHIYSSRSKIPKAIDAMATWLYSNGLKTHVNFPVFKPSAFLTIDDRCIRFDGNFDQLPTDYLLSFKPWNKR